MSFFLEIFGCEEPEDSENSSENSREKKKKGSQDKKPTLKDSKK